MWLVKQQYNPFTKGGEHDLFDHFFSVLARPDRFLSKMIKISEIAHIPSSNGFLGVPKMDPFWDTV